MIAGLIIAGILGALAPELGFLALLLTGCFVVSTTVGGIASVVIGGIFLLGIATQEYRKSKGS